MKPLVIACNILSVAFTLLVLATDGLATEASYIALTLLLILVPVVTVLALARPNTFPGPATTAFRAAGIANLVLLGWVCWALVEQHPHPNEPGFLPYAGLMILTPILSAVALLRRQPGGLQHG